MRWRFALVESSNLDQITMLSQARGRSVQTIHNKPGGCSFQYPITADYAEYIEPWKTGIMAYRYNWRASVTAGVPVWDEKWSGFVYNIDEDISGNSMSVNAVGWLARLDKRVLRRQKIYTNQDDGDIILDLVDEMNLDPGPAPESYNFTPMAGSSKLTLIDSGSKLPDDGVTGSYRSLLDAPLGGVGRNRTYEAYTTVLPEIYGLMDLENGCDLRVDPVTRMVNIYRKRQIVQEEAAFGYKGAINNISQIGRQIDPSSQINYMLVRGKTVVSQFAHDLVASGIYGPLEEVANLNEIASSGVLLAYAGGEIIVRANPKVTYAFTPFSYRPNGNIPEPFVDYDVGDRVYFSARKGNRIQIENQAQRVFGISVNIEDNGSEKMAPLQLAPS